MEYRILTFKILFWHSTLDRISYFDIQNPILTFKLRPNIVFWHSKSYFDIRTEAEYLILTFKILFWHSNWDRISYFDIQNPILTFELGPNIVFDIQNPILTFEFGRNIAFSHSKSYSDIRTGTEYRILTFKILFWHSNWGRISYFDIHNPILIFKLGPNIVFWHSKTYFDIPKRAEYRILTFKILFWHSKTGRISYFDIQILFWHSNWGRISYFDIQNPILTFKLGPNIVFWY